MKLTVGALYRNRYTAYHCYRFSDNNITVSANNVVIIKRREPFVILGIYDNPQPQPYGWIDVKILTINGDIVWTRIPEGSPLQKVRKP